MNLLQPNKFRGFLSIFIILEGNHQTLNLYACFNDYKLDQHTYFKFILLQKLYYTSLIMTGNCELQLT